MANNTRDITVLRKVLGIVLMESVSRKHLGKFKLYIFSLKFKTRFSCILFLFSLLAKNQFWFGKSS